VQEYNHYPFYQGCVNKCGMPRKFQHRRDTRNLFQISQQFWYLNSSHQRPDRIFLFCVQFECQVQTNSRLVLILSKCGRVESSWSVYLKYRNMYFSVGTIVM
jgi:hypothetical protein